MKVYANLRILIPYIRRTKIYLIFGFIGIILVSAIVAPLPYLIGKVLDILLINNIKFTDVQGVLLLIITIYSIKFLVNISYQYFFVKLQQNIVNEIKMDIVEKLIDAPLSFINKREKGYVLSRIGEVQQIGAIFSPTIITSFVSVFEIIFCFITMLYINVKLTLIAATIVPGYFTISKVISKKITKNTIIVQENMANLNADIFETLNGIEEVKLLNGKQTQLNKIFLKTKMVIKSAIKQNLSMIAFIQSLSFVSDIVNVGILALAGAFIIRGEITVGVYTTFSIYINKILGVTQSVGTFEITIKPVCATIERIKEFLFVNLESKKDASILKESISEIFFENVSFGYKNNKLFINKVSNRFSEGDRILLLGDNGSGKTTFIKLLVGLYDPIEGNILVNGENMRGLNKEDIRKKVGIVSQDIFLFKGSVLDNILFGVDGKNRKDVVDLLEKFKLIDYINRLPNGLDTEITENGVGISGGQAQIIAFIRAIIKEKDILILDEATSNLEQDACKKIISILSENELYKMLFIISHQDYEYKFVNKIIRF